MEYLETIGYAKDGNVYTKEIVKDVVTVVVNGQQQVQQQKVRLTIKYIGEGEITDDDGTNTVKLYGYEMNGIVNYVEKQEELGKLYRL